MEAFFRLFGGHFCTGRGRRKKSGRTSNLRSNLMFWHASGNDFSDRYRLDGTLLGEGCVGSVRQATRINTGEQVAIKSVLLQNISKDLSLELYNEVTIMQKLEHPNVVKLYETYEHKGQLHMVMELCSGGNLYCRKYTEDKAREVITKICRAVAYCHGQNVAHRDLKFENVLFETDDVDAQIKLIDFGFSMKYGDGQLMSQSVGTIYSMAPEVLCGKTYTNACDAWSIGVIAYMLLSQNFAIPFDGEDDVEIAKNILECHLDLSSPHWSTVSESAKDFIRNCLAKYPHQRYSVQTALQSDWLTGAKPQPVSDEVKKKLLVSLQEYISFPKFKRGALMMIAFSLRSSDPRMKPLRQVFSVFEANSRDGRITFAQFKSSFEDLGYKISDEELRAIFVGIDMDKSERLDYLEFNAACLHGFGLLNDRTLAKVFDDLDSQGRGYISVQDLKTALGTDYDEEIFQSFVKTDTSNKGRIHFHEFNAFMRKPNALSVFEYLNSMGRESFVDEISERPSRTQTTNISSSIAPSRYDDSGNFDDGFEGGKGPLKVGMSDLKERMSCTRSHSMTSDDGWVMVDPAKVYYRVNNSMRTHSYVGSRSKQSTTFLKELAELNSSISFTLPDYDDRTSVDDIELSRNFGD